MGCGGSRAQEVDVEEEERPRRPPPQPKKDLTPEEMLEEEKLGFLKFAPIMRRVGKDDRLMLTKIMEPCEFEVGAVVQNLGDASEDFHMIRKGEASMQRRDGDGNMSKLRSLFAGDYFGDITGDPYTSQVVADKALSTYVLRRHDVENFGLMKVLQVPQRKVIGLEHLAAGEDDEAELGEVQPKSDEEKEFLRKVLGRSPHIKRGEEWNQKDHHQQRDNTHNVTAAGELLEKVIDVARKEVVKAGQEFLQEGNQSNDNFYIIQSGGFDCHATEPDENEVNNDAGPFYKVAVGDDFVATEDPPINGNVELFGSLKAGDTFGELSMLYHKDKGATVVATSDSVVWIIPRRVFKKILLGASASKHKLYRKFIDKVTGLAHLYDDEKNEVAKAMTEIVFHRSDNILVEGEVADGMYVLMEGQVIIVQGGKPKKTITSTAASKQLQIFGEGSLKADDKQKHTIKVFSKKATVLFLERTHLEIVLGTLEALSAPGKQEKFKMSRVGHMEGQQTCEHAEAIAGVVQKAANKASAEGRRGSMGRGRLGSMASLASLNSVEEHYDEANADGGQENSTKGCRGMYQKQDLKTIGVLGCGGFGKVELVEHAPTGNTYALKCMSKGFIVAQNAQYAMMNEKALMVLTDSPFIIKLWETYNDPQHLYFLLEVCLGGELQVAYQTLSLHGSVPHAVFYTACTFLAFCHLHDLCIVHRDLKPENLVLSEHGYAKLMDFGMAKICIGKTYTLCGTVDYMPPEVIKFAGADTGRDWWALGVLIYELMTGHAPFEGKNGMEVCSNIGKGIEAVEMPEKLKGDCEDVLFQLMEQDSAARLPMSQAGREKFTKLPWYSSIDWEAMEYGDATVPYKPIIKNSKDLSHFQQDVKELPSCPFFPERLEQWDKGFASAAC